MINAETKRYIDQQIDRLRREMKASLGKKSDTITISGDTVSYAITAGTAGYALSAGEAEVYGGTVSFAVNAGTASVYGGTVGYAQRAGEADVYGGTVGYAEEAGSVTLVAGSTNVHFYGVTGNTVTVDDFLPDFDGTITDVGGTKHTAQVDEVVFVTSTIFATSDYGDEGIVYVEISGSTTVLDYIYVARCRGITGATTPGPTDVYTSRACGSVSFSLPAGMSVQVKSIVLGGASVSNHCYIVPRKQ